MAERDPHTPLTLADLPQAGPVFTQLRQAMGVIVLASLVFFSGFGAFGAALFHWQESAFFRTSVNTTAKVERVVEGTRRRTETRDNRTIDIAETIYTAHVVFEDARGMQHTATLPLGTIATHSPGSQMTIAYQPDAPHSVRQARSAENIPVLLRVSQILGVVFLISLTALIVLSTRRKT